MTHKGFIALILSGALALTGLSTAPARADAQDTAKIIAGVVGLAILGAAIADRNDKDDHVTRHDTYNYHPKKHKKPDWKRVNRHHNAKRALPGKCRVYRDGKRGPKYGYDGRCLRRNFSGFHDLPNHCAVKSNGHRGRIFRENCLSQYGYRAHDTRQYKKHSRHYDPYNQYSK